MNDAIKNIKNFVNKDTIIISLLNGVTSEDIIAAVYGKEKTSVLILYRPQRNKVRKQNYP